MDKYQDQNAIVDAPFIIASDRPAYSFKIIPRITDIPIRKVIINELIDARRLMGAFWNPNGGLIVNGRKLSKNEVAGLKRRWSASHRQMFGSLNAGGERLRLLYALFSAKPITPPLGNLVCTSNNLPLNSCVV